MKTINKIMLFASVFMLSLLISGPANAAKSHGTTVERDANGCTVHVTLQFGVEGDSAQVVEVSNALTPIGNLTCKIACPDPLTDSCTVDVTVSVVAWSDLPDSEQAWYHHITVVDDDGNPSMATIGTPNGASGSGTYRAGSSAAEFQHEAMHNAGLSDSYCGNHRGHYGFTEPSCPDPPGPNPCDCVLPAPPPTKARCTKPCTGSENDIMATLSASVTCDNILAVVALASLNSCPVDPCCPSTPPDGDDCTDPAPIPEEGIPYQDSRNTNNYNNSCSLTGGFDSNDVIYELLLTQPRLLTVSLCGSEFDTKLGIFYENCCTGPGTEMFYNDNECGLQSEITAEFLPGRYFIVVDGAGGTIAATGYYTLNIFEPANSIPTLSEWGILVLSLLLLASGTVAIIRRKRFAASK